MEKPDKSEYLEIFFGRVLNLSIKLPRKSDKGGDKSKTALSVRLKDAQDSTLSTIVVQWAAILRKEGVPVYHKAEGDAHPHLFYRLYTFPTIFPTLFPVQTFLVQ